MDQQGDEHTSLEIAVERNDDVGLLRLAGQLDISTTDRVLSAIRSPEVEGVTQWAIDCSDLSFVDSGGLRAILAIAGQVGGLDGIALYEPRPQFLNLLRMAGLDSQITIRPAEPL